MTIPLLVTDTGPELATLPSYLQGRWWVPEVSGEQAPLARDAATGEPIARISAEGADLAGAVAYARGLGQRNLGELTFHQRALQLKQLAIFLNDHRGRLYEISARTGATPADHLIDIDGGIGVLFTFGSKGRRELPNAKVMIDGPAEMLSRDGSFIGEHIYTRIPGVAVQINAFNFPVWGMLEKFAPAFIAGVPTIVKPATSTGYLTEAVVRLIIESGIVPEGSLQLISGAARNLLDHLDYRDLVAFTGSAATASRLREHPCVVNGGVRFTAETDSLNAAILGPDAVPGTPEFEAFICSVVQEITAKAGQKCTSIRRVIVPEELQESVVSALSDRLRERVVLGDPRAEGVTMGALASGEQLADVRAAVQTMVAAGGHLVHGSLDSPMVIRGDGSQGLAPEGAFMAPVLLSWREPTTAELHEVEAFGPVASVLSYRSLDEAIELAARGSGSLVATVCSHDPLTVEHLVTSLAAHHGRVLVLDRDDAHSSTGHGAPVPHLLHGGPGRAGGGEELGGMRAVRHHMQRTAIQGSPDMLTAVTGVWHPGAKRFFDRRHPFRKSLAELRLGDAYASPLRQVSLQDISDFGAETGDTFYAHTDAEAAAENPFFPGIVAHGYLLISWAAGLFVDPEPGPVLANYGLENLRFITPLAAGDSFRVTLTAKQITPREDQDYGEVRWDAILHNQDDEIVATYDVLTLVAKTQAGVATETEARLAD